MLSKIISQTLRCIDLILDIVMDTLITFGHSLKKKANFNVDAYCLITKIA